MQLRDKHRMNRMHRWSAMWQALGARRVDVALYRRLLDCHAEPHRRYHTLQHLDECLAHFDALRGEADHAAEAEAALWFHDAIHRMGRDDNERQSADWARSALLEVGIGRAAADRVHGMVMATRHEALPAGRDDAVVVDADLAILGADRLRFDEYERQVAAEYAHLPEPVYRQGRIRVLQSFIDRGRIFSTQRFLRTREAAARENLVRAIQRLGG
jgi:predicted metal-dependent HD superfamily phosphohydrolase